MTDNGDETYEADYTILGGTGTVAISAEVFTRGGLYAEHFTNISLAGDPEVCQTDADIDNYWAGIVDPLTVWDNISVRWTGQIRSPSFETYTINIEKNRAYMLTIAGSSTMDNSSTNEHT